MDGPVKPSTPAEDTVGQLCEESAVQGGEVSITLKGIGKELVYMSLRISDPVKDSKRDRPRGFRRPTGMPGGPQNLPVLAISSSLAILSSMGGWVLKRDMTPPPLRGLTMKR